jgi:glutathione-regulated potassium-efflux system protein KefB
LVDILWFLLASVIAVPLFRRFGFSAVLGYLFVGLILGPSGLRVISDPESTLAISELGVVMMLFVCKACQELLCVWRVVVSHYQANLL